MDPLTIDPEFSSWCRPLTIAERANLEASLERDGCLDPIILWANHDDTIIDGHTRYEICQQLGISFKTKSLRFDTREEVLEWIDQHQDGRRNDTEEQREYRLGKRYRAENKGHGGGRKNDASGQNVHLKTAAKIASEHGVDEKTIRRAGKFADAVDAISENVGKEAKAEILSGRSGLTKKAVVEIAKEAPEKQAEAVAKAKETGRVAPASKSEFDTLADRIGKAIALVEEMAASRMGHTSKSKATLACLQDALTKAESWRKAQERA